MIRILVNVALVSILLGTPVLAQASSFEVLTRITPKIRVIDMPKKIVPVQKTNPAMAEPEQKKPQAKIVSPAKPDKNMMPKKALPKITRKQTPQPKLKKMLAASKVTRKGKKLQLRTGQPDLPVVKVNKVVDDRPKH